MSSIQVTSDLVKSAIAMKLSTSFPNIDIYKEQVIEGIEYPSFFINQIIVVPVPIYKNKGYLEFSMAINYIENPNDTNLYQKLENMGIELISALSFINVGTLKIKGKNIETQKNEDTQVTSVMYRIPYMEVASGSEDGELMRVLDLNIL